MDHLQWMGAVRVQTADKNITIIHKVSIYISSRLVNVLWSKKLRICKKTNPSRSFNFKPFIFLFFTIHNMAFSSEKVTLSESEDEYAQI